MLLLLQCNIWTMLISYVCKSGVKLLTVNRLTGPKSGTGHVWNVPVNRNCSHLIPPQILSVHCGLTSIACCCYCMLPSWLAPAGQLRINYRCLGHGHYYQQTTALDWRVRGDCDAVPRPTDGCRSAALEETWTVAIPSTQQMHCSASWRPCVGGAF